MSNYDLLAKSIGAKVVSDEPVVENQPAVVEETPVAQETQPTKTEESSLKSEPESKDSEPSIDINEYIKESFDNRFSSIDEIKSALETKSEPQKIEYANEMVEQLDKMVREGWSIEEYMNVYSKDYNSLSDEEVIKQAMMMEDKSLSSEDLDFLYDSDYGYDEEVDDDREIRLKQIKIKKEAAKSREKLNQFKESYQPKNVAERVNQEQQIKAIQERWNNALDSTSISQIESKDNFKYEVSQEVLNEVKNDVRDLNNYFAKYVNKDGTENIPKLLEDQLKIRLFDEAISTAMTMAKSQGREEVVSNRDNVQPPKENRPQGSKPVMAQLYEQAKQKGFF